MFLIKKNKLLTTLTHKYQIITLITTIRLGSFEK